MARLQIVGLPSYNRTKRTASTNLSGKAKKDAAASTSSGPAKDAKTAAPSPQGAGKQDESQVKFQALRDSMPPTSPDATNPAKASSESKPSEKKADAKADEGTTGKGFDFSNWSTKKKVLVGLSAVGGLWFFSKIMQSNTADKS